MSWKGKKVLVTGAGGFIGSHLVERLVEEGAVVTALVRYSSDRRRGWLGGSSAESRVRFVHGDIRDPDCVDTAVAAQEIVFHLAALIAIPYSYAAPQSYLETNVLGTLNVLRAARANATGRVVHTSTSEVYGSAQYTPIDEGHPLVGQSPYSASKIGGDKIAEAFHLSFQVPLVTVRPFNTFGPRQSARAVIPTIVTQALRRNVVELGSLEPTRDLTYVSDTVDGFLAAASAGERSVGQVFNLGSGRDISIGALARKILDLLGSDAQIRTQQERMRPDGSEVVCLRADASRARDVLDWAPRLSLDEGLARTIHWFRENPDTFSVGEYVF